tara:strand:+ start:1625 stop:2314 length:690 start_codon:yes stop_codon:yes gene_type:complete
MKAALKRIINIDMKRVEEANLNEQGIFIEFDEKDMFQAKAMIIGPKDTIYENAYLFFTIEFPKKYPFEPPVVTYKPQNTVRIHPNIYVNGKVCLSILGTWSGPSWTSAMDIINVLITIQSLLDDQPLCNEPGYEKIVPSKMHIHNDYNMVIEYNTYNSLILGRLHTKFEEFDNFKKDMIEYFEKNKTNIIKKIEKNMEKYKDKLSVRIGIYNIYETIDYQYLHDKYLKI